MHYKVTVLRRFGGNSGDQEGTAISKAGYANGDSIMTPAVRMLRSWLFVSDRVEANGLTATLESGVFSGTCGTGLAPIVAAATGAQE